MILSGAELCSWLNKASEKCKKYYKSSVFQAFKSRKTAISSYRSELVCKKKTTSADRKWYKMSRNIPWGASLSYFPTQKCE